MRDNADTRSTDTQNPELNAIVREMNKLGIPMQQQADENPEYWILRSHYAEEEAGQNPAASVAHDPAQPSGAPHVQLQLGYGILAAGLGAMTVLTYGRLRKRDKRDPTHKQ